MVSFQRMVWRLVRDGGAKSCMCDGISYFVTAQPAIVCLFSLRIQTRNSIISFNILSSLLHFAWLSYVWCALLLSLNSFFFCLACWGFFVFVLSLLMSLAMMSVWNWVWTKTCWALRYTLNNVNVCMKIIFALVGMMTRPTTI